jgi:hypothetical protein
MRKKHLIRLLVLSAVCCVFAQDVEGGIFRKRRCRRPCRPRDCAQRGPERTSSCLGKICPLYKYADHGSYCSYYSQNCGGTHCSVDAACGLPPGSCSSCLYPCYTAPRGVVASHNNNHVRPRFDGVERYPVQAGTNGAHTVGDPLYVKFDKPVGPSGHRPVYAKLLRFLVQPWTIDKPGPEIETFVGYEVHPSEVPASVPTHPADLIPGKKHCFSITPAVNGPTYQVITLIP